MNKNFKYLREKEGKEMKLSRLQGGGEKNRILKSINRLVIFDKALLREGHFELDAKKVISGKEVERVIRETGV